MVIEAYDIGDTFFNGREDEGNEVFGVGAKMNEARTEPSAEGIQFGDHSRVSSSTATD